MGSRKPKGNEVVDDGQPRTSHGRRVVDRLDTTLVLERSESEWLLTLLNADDLRYIFDGIDHGEAKT